MMQKILQFFSALSAFRTKRSLRKETEALLAAVENTQIDTLTRYIEMRDKAPQLHEDGHTATANAINEWYAALDKQFAMYVSKKRNAIGLADKKALRALIDELRDYKNHITMADFAGGLLTSPTHEIALRREIGDRARSVDHLKSDLTVLMIRKMGMLTVHDTEPIIDFAHIIEEWSRLNHAPRIHNFTGLRVHLETLTRLSVRMHDLMDTLKQMH
jgi:hypothetical protein